MSQLHVRKIIRINNLERNFSIIITERMKALFKDYHNACTLQYRETYFIIYLMFSYHFIQTNINYLLPLRLHNESILLCKMLRNKNKTQLTCVVASTDRAHEHFYFINFMTMTLRKIDVWSPECLRTSCTNS